MNIPLTDLKAQYAAIKDEVSLAIKEVLEESNFVLGRQVDLFEREVARYFGVEFAVGVASGSDALALSLAALGIGKGDEVITTPFTFIATSQAIARVGARPVFCDIEYDTYNIDPEQIKKCLTPKTKAVIPVHLYGMPCSMDEIMPMAKESGLKVIEDCAQSFGSEYRGKKAGAYADAGCLSFFPAKTLGCFGDGGMIITNNEQTAQKVKMLRNHGAQRRYYYATDGFNSRLDTLQAAVLRVKLKYIDAWIDKRIENANYYSRLLKGAGGIEVASVPEYIRHGFNYYTIRVKGRRNLLKQRLDENGVACAVYYPLCLHLQEVYRGLGYKEGDFPVAEEAQEEALSLPMYPELTKKQIDEITRLIWIK